MLKNVTPQPCELCPRRCASRGGFCGNPDDQTCVVAKTMVHPWEEPCVSGQNGSGAIFFAGCNLRCVFCQNSAVSWPRPLAGTRVDALGLLKYFLELQSQGVENINLVSPSHVLPVAQQAMQLARREGFALPFVWNSNGYENPEALHSLEGLVDFYLPDLKYCDDALALRYSNAPNYFRHAAAAILEMVAQSSRGTHPGVLVRHMILPGCRHDSLRILEWIAANAPSARLSLLAQYTPMGQAAQHPPLHRRLTGFEYESVAARALALGLQGYFQQRAAATAQYTPVFSSAVPHLSSAVPHLSSAVPHST